MKRALEDVTDATLNGQRVRPTRTHLSLCPRGRSRCLRDGLVNRSLGNAFVSPVSYAASLLDDLDLYSTEDERLNLSEGEIPFAVACAKTCSLTAVGKESGGVYFFDHSEAASERTNGPFLFEVRNHQNAIFDVEWSSDDRRLAVASGDQTVSILDVTTQTAMSRLHGHSSTVKEFKFDPTNEQICATGGRDGRILVWDLRQSTNGTIRPVSQIPKAHDPTNGTPTKKNDKAPGISITALLYKPDGQLVSACASNPILLTWDLRYLRTDVSTGTPRGHFPFLDPTQYTRPTPSLASTRLRSGRSTPPPSHSPRERSYGVTSLVLSAGGDKMYSMNRNNRIYEYVSSHPDLGPTKCIQVPDLVVRSFYSKSSINAEGILVCGNANGNPIVIDTTRPAPSSHTSLSTRDATLLTRTSSSSPASSQDQENRPPSSFTQAASDPLKSISKVSMLRNTSGSSSRELSNGHGQECTGISWSHDGSAVVSIGDDARSRVWRHRGRH